MVVDQLFVMALQVLYVLPRSLHFWSKVLLVVPLVLFVVPQVYVSWCSLNTFCGSSGTVHLAVPQVPHVSDQVLPVIPQVLLVSHQVLPVVPRVLIIVPRVPTSCFSSGSSCCSSGTSCLSSGTFCCSSGTSCCSSGTVLLVSPQVLSVVP